MQEWQELGNIFEQKEHVWFSKISFENMSHCYPTKPLRNKTLDAETKCAFVKDYEALGQLWVSFCFFHD